MVRPKRPARPKHAPKTRGRYSSSTSHFARNAYTFPQRGHVHGFPAPRNMANYILGFVDVVASLSRLLGLGVEIVLSAQVPVLFSRLASLT